MTVQATHNSISDSGFDKEAYTGLRGRTCRYCGDASAALEIELAPGDVLTVTAAQVRNLFADLGAFNWLLEDCLGMAPRMSLIESIKAAARVRRMRRSDRRARTGRNDPYASLVSARFRAWLDEHAKALWGRPLDNEQAACLQGVFAGEGLLPFEGDRPGEFPAADPLASLRALQGSRVIYEEDRRFIVAELYAVTTSERDPDQVSLFLRNLSLPGFCQEFPAEFTAGGSLKATSLGFGMIHGYMGTWSLITSPRAVERLVAAAPGLDRKGLLDACRQVQFGRAPKVY